MARKETLWNCRSDPIIRIPEQHKHEDSERSVRGIRNQRSYTKGTLEDTQSDGEQLVPVFLAFERPFHWNVDVIGLFLTQNGQLCTDL